MAIAPLAMTRPMATMNARLPELNIEDLPVRLDLPALDRIVVVDRVGAAFFPELRHRRLHKAGLINDPGLDQGRPTVPAPFQSEFGQRFRQHGLMQRCHLPTDATVGRDVDALDLAVAG